MTIRLMMFSDKDGYLYSDVRLQKPFLCKFHGCGVKRDFFCELGKHELSHPESYEVINVEDLAKD